MTNKTTWLPCGKEKGLDVLVANYHDSKNNSNSTIGYVYFNDNDVYYSFDVDTRRLNSDSVESAKRVIELSWSELYDYQPPSEGEYEEE